MPFLLIFDPILITHSPFHPLVISMCSAVIGILFLSSGIAGWLLTEANWWERILLLIGGVGFFIPGWAAKPAVLVLVFPLLSQIVAHRKTKRKAMPAMEHGA